MYKTYTCKFLLIWGNYTKRDPNQKWPNWSSFDIPKLIFTGTELEKAGHNVKQTGWNAYFDWYLEASLKTVEQKKTANSLSLILSLPLIFSSIWIAWPDAVSLFFVSSNSSTSCCSPVPRKGGLKQNQNFEAIFWLDICHSLTTKMILCLSLPLQFSSA